MVNPQNRNLSELNTCFFSSFDRLPHRVNHINFNLYHYAGNNPVKYIDPDGREDIYENEFTIKLYLSFDQLEDLAINYEFLYEDSKKSISEQLLSAVDTGGYIVDALDDLFTLIDMSEGLIGTCISGAGNAISFLSLLLSWVPDNVGPARDAVNKLFYTLRDYEKHYGYEIQGVVCTMNFYESKSIVNHHDNIIMTSRSVYVNMQGYALGMKIIQKQSDFKLIKEKTEF